MLKNIKDYISKGLSNGFEFPKVKDDFAVPSATLWFAYASFAIACGAVIHFIIKGDFLSSSITAIGFWTIAMVFYKFKDIDKFKVNLREGQVEVEDEEDTPKT